MRRKSRFFEDFKVDQQFGWGYFGPVRVSEAMIYAFACLMGDKLGLHVDPKGWKAGLFGRQAAHGLLTLSLINGLACKAGVWEKSCLALLGIEARFYRPVFPADKLFLTLRVVEKRDLKKDGSHNEKMGNVIFWAKLAKDEEGKEVVLTTEFEMRIAKRAYFEK